MPAASGPPSAYLYNVPLSILLPPPAPSCPASHLKAILLTHPHQAHSDSRKGEQHSRLLYFIIDKVLCTTGCSFRWSEISLLNNNSGRKSPLKNLVINSISVSSNCIKFSKYFTDTSNSKSLSKCPDLVCSIGSSCVFNA